MKKKKDDDMIYYEGPIKPEKLTKEELDRTNPYKQMSKKLIEKKKKESR